jgi:DinB superfamily
MDPRLDELKRSLESAVEGMSTEQWRWHPPGKWCAAELLEHLYLTYTGTIKGFQRVMTSGKPLGSLPSMANRLRTFVVVGLGHMPGGVKAPAVSVPKGLPVAKVCDELGAKIVEMDAIITQCEARFGRRVRVLDHPILGPLTAPQWRKMHVVHGRHHLKQLLQLREGAKKQMG